MNGSGRILTRELMRDTEQYLCEKGYRKSTLGVYKATWNRFLAFSESEHYDRLEAEKYLLKHFGVDVNSIDQRLDKRMRQARRHMNSLDEFYHKGYVSRKHIRELAPIKKEAFEQFFGEYLEYCRMQNYSSSWISYCTSGLNLFLMAAYASDTADVRGINAQTIQYYSDIVINAEGISPNTKIARTRKVGGYLNWLYIHKYTNQDYSRLLPEFKRTPKAIPTIWSEDEIERLVAAIDTVSPVGKRNYAIFLLLVRTGLRIGDIVTIKFSNIDWKNNVIILSQQKTGNVLSLPLSKEVGLAIISYLKHGRPFSESDHIFLSHNAPFQPLNAHNNFNREMLIYMRRAGITRPKDAKKGVHSLRHSFATNMLKQGVSVQNISQILGHSSVNVTETYLRVDVDQLRLCALGLEAVI